MRRPAHPPADNPAGEGVDDEGHIDEALPGGHIGEIRNPEPVRRRSLELAVHPIERAGSRLVRDRRADRLATDDTLKSHRSHEPGDGAAGYRSLPASIAARPCARRRRGSSPRTHGVSRLQCNVAASADRQPVHVRRLATFSS